MKRKRSPLTIIRKIFNQTKVTPIRSAKLKKIIPESSLRAKYINLITFIQAKPLLKMMKVPGDRFSLSKKFVEMIYLQPNHANPPDMLLPKYDKTQGKRRNSFTIIEEIFQFITREKQIIKSDLRQILSPPLINRYLNLITIVQQKPRLIVEQRDTKFYISIMKED